MNKISSDSSKVGACRARSKHFLDLAFVPVGHGRNDRLFVGEIAINQTNADAGLGADIVHAGLVKAALGEANEGSIEDLGAPIEGRFKLGLGHGSKR